MEKTAQRFAPPTPLPGRPMTGRSGAHLMPFIQRTANACKYSEKHKAGRIRCWVAEHLTQCCAPGSAPFDLRMRYCQPSASGSCEASSSAVGLRKGERGLGFSLSLRTADHGRSMPSFVQRSHPVSPSGRSITPGMTRNGAFAAAAWCRFLESHVACSEPAPWTPVPCRRRCAMLT
jgi:hypothetical protein